MNRLINVALLRKCCREAQWLLLGCMAVMLSFCWIRVRIVSGLDMDRFKEILDLLPGDWQRFSPVEFAWLVTYAGRISLTYDEAIVVFCMSIWAIARGSDVVSGELSRGSMELLLAQPISRMQVLWTQSGVTLLGAALLALASWLGVYAGIATSSVKEEVRPVIWLPVVGPVPNYLAPTEKREAPMETKVNAGVFAPASFSLFCLGAMLAGVSALVSACDRYRWRTIGIVVGMYVVSLIAKLVGMYFPWLTWMTYCSVFTVYEPEAFVQTADLTPEHAWSVLLYNSQGDYLGFGPLGYCSVLLAVGAACYLGASLIFQRRDLPAPL
ncbi:ABC transporter permease subunit [Lignipirellula cremea]|uniref:ABC-2 family transporter protein n=1 Tax=Lignipirellula cremea TaxID=2528010 RepID=A0A518DNV6_9BACT|nr:ABC transporter permease subunit [Lignipirellula cremea]QDU93516.1 ABC-2 family transporter protein [Lignipirellula cremea]